MFRSVDFPEPDEPEIAANSPFFIEKNITLEIRAESQNGMFILMKQTH